MVRFLVVLAAGLATVLAAVPFTPAEAQWVFVARKALGRIHQMTEGPQNGRPGYDFATVILDAPADKVFATALETARKNTSVRILMHRFGHAPAADRRRRPHRHPECRVVQRRRLPAHDRRPCGAGRRVDGVDGRAGRAARLQGNGQALRSRQLRPQKVEHVGATTMSLMQIVGGSFQQ